MRIASLALLIACFANRGLVADDADSSWPPPLPGAVQGTVKFTSPELLVVPDTVRDEAAASNSAPFVVARRAPIVELAFHGQLGSGARDRRLWSSWGDICVAGDGRVYCAIGDHGNDVGGDARCFIYRWDPARHVLEQVVDMNQVVPPREGQPAWSKVHARLDEGPDGKIYFSCTLNSGDKARLPTYGFNDRLPGGQLYRFDPATGKTEVFANLPPRRVTATSLLDRQRNTWWCNLEAGNEGHALYGVNLATREVVFRAPDGSMGFNRAFALANDGSIYFNGADRLQKLDRVTLTIAPTRTSFSPSPGMRSVTAESRDGYIFGITQTTHQLFQYSLRDDELELLEPGWLTGSYTAITVLSPDEKYLYYLPGSHGQAFKHGTPIVRYERDTGQRTVLAFLAPYCERHYDYVPAGTYGMKLSPDGRTMYVNFNGHAVDKHRPKHHRPNGFGLTAFAAIHLADEP